MRNKHTVLPIIDFDISNLCKKRQNQNQSPVNEINQGQGICMTTIGTIKKNYKSKKFNYLLTYNCTTKGSITKNAQVAFILHLRFLVK